MDKVGNTTKTTHNDGSYWDYTYDDRYQLLTAIRNNKTSPTIKAEYRYTYDDGDNMLTKIEPFMDDFNNENYSGWTINAGTWSAANGYMDVTTGGGGGVTLMFTLTPAVAAAGSSALRDRDRARTACR